MTDSILTSNDAGNRIAWQFDNTYSRLPDSLFTAAIPSPVKEPRISVFNHRMAKELGLDFDLSSPQTLASIFSGQEIPQGAYPIAQAYAGHQYGHFTILGDGRAILLGEQRTPSGRLFDIQLKGPGRTRYSRGGDGRAALGPMLREYIISEAMHALGIPTTRSLAVVTTGDPVLRSSPLRGAVLTRVAASHIRIGTFEFAARRDDATLRALADYAIERHDPNLVNSPNKYADFLLAVADRQASLIAKWQLIGFIHGVMNTDNMAISGETIDYGPCAFMNAYDPATVFSSIDHGGRYAYRNQPNIAQWNLARFAETLIPLLADDREKAIAIAMEILTEFPLMFEQYWLAGMKKKLGIQNEDAGDADLIQSLLGWMTSTHADYTNTFRDLSSGEPLMGSYSDPDFQSWHARWKNRIGLNSEAYTLMRTMNPVVIPRNHRVEEVLTAAEEQDDLSPLHNLLAALASPYESREGLAYYQEPQQDQTSYRTYCGT